MIYSGILNTQHPQVQAYAQHLCNTFTERDTQKLHAWIRRHPKIQHPVQFTLGKGEICTVHPGRTRFVYSVLSDTPLTAWANTIHKEYDLTVLHNPRTRLRMPNTHVKTIHDWIALVDATEPVPYTTLDEWRSLHNYYTNN